MSQPIRPGLRIYEMKGNHFEERRPCLRPGHCSVVRMGRWGGVGTARGPATLGMDRERKVSEKPGSKVFLGRGKKTEQAALLLAGVFSPCGAMALPKGQGGTGASRPLPASARSPHPSKRAEAERARFNHF